MTCGKKEIKKSSPPKAAANGGERFAFKKAGIVGVEEAANDI